MFSLDEKSKDSISKTTGLTVEQIADMDFDEIDRHLGTRVKHDITDFIMDSRLLGRGQVYSYVDRFIDITETGRVLKRYDRKESGFIRKIISTVYKPR